MACCKCCCGNVDCEEGQEGKCCCGGPEGECCQEGEYCCNGACQDEPCCCGVPPKNCTLTVTITGGPGEGTYEWDFDAEAWVDGVPLGEIAFDPVTCVLSYEESDSPSEAPCNSWSALASARIVCEECCESGRALGCLLYDPTFTLTQDTDCTGVAPTDITLELNCEGDSCCAGPCDSDEDCEPDCACVDGECVPAGLCCYKSVAGAYSFSINAASGTITDGLWSSTPEFISIYCTPGAVNCGVTQGDGLFLEYYDGTDTWQGYEAGNAMTYPCESSAALPGTYTLTNCTTSATATLTIT